MAGTYEHLNKLPNKSRQGGSQQRIFIMDYDDFQTLNKPDPAATDIHDRFKIKVPHVPKATKGFIEVYVTKDTGSCKFTPIGASDRLSFKAEGEFYHPGESDEIVAFLNQILNGRYIVLFTLPGTDELLQVGSNEFQVEIKPEYDTTTNGGDGRGTKFSFWSYMPALIKYVAAVPLQGAGA
jgi:hypothetical protein